MEASAHCHVSSFSLSTVDKEEEVKADSDLHNEHVVIMDIRCQDTKATPEQKEYFFPTSPNEETDDDDESHHSVNSCFSHCSNDKELFLNCHPRKEGDEHTYFSSNNRHKLISSIIMETSANCHVSSSLKPPSSLSSFDEQGAAQHDSDLDNDNVVIMSNRRRATATKVKPKQKDYFFSTSSNEETDDDKIQVFHSVKSCFSHCSSEKESLLNCFKRFHTGSIWEHIRRCEGWPFGLYRRALMAPPLPNSPSDSWTWHRSTHGRLSNSKTVIRK